MNPDLPGAHSRCRMKLTRTRCLFQLLSFATLWERCRLMFGRLVSCKGIINDTETKSYFLGSPQIPCISILVVLFKIRQRISLKFFKSIHQTSKRNYLHLVLKESRQQPDMEGGKLHIMIDFKMPLCTKRPHTLHLYS